MSTFTVTTLGLASWGDGRSAKDAPASQSYLGAGRAFLAGAEVLTTEANLNPMSAALLLAQAAENGLKAWLWKDGERKDIKNDSKVRHDLTELWRKAQAEGLAIEPAPPEWLASLAELHRFPYQDRYATKQALVVHKNFGPQLEGAAQLLSTVAQALAL